MPTGKLLIPDWSTQRVNFALCTSILPGTMGDVIWGLLRMSLPTQTNLKWPPREVKVVTAHLPSPNDSFCLPGPEVQLTSSQQGPSQSLSLPETAHWVTAVSTMSTGGLAHLIHQSLVILPSFQHWELFTHCGAWRSHQEKPGRKIQLQIPLKRKDNNYSFQLR